MGRTRIGLDWFDLLIHVGITLALTAVAGTASVRHPETGVGLVIAVSLGVLAWRRQRALQRSPEMTTGEVAAERVYALEDRLAELEAQQARILELEERLDFAERMLVRRADQPALGTGDRP